MYLFDLGTCSGGLHAKAGRCSQWDAPPHSAFPHLGQPHLEKIQNVLKPEKRSVWQKENMEQKGNKASKPPKERTPKKVQKGKNRQGRGQKASNELKNVQQKGE